MGIQLHKHRPHFSGNGLLGLLSLSGQKIDSRVSSDLWAGRGGGEVFREAPAGGDLGRPWDRNVCPRSFPTERERRQTGDQAESGREWVGSSSLC